MAIEVGEEIAVSTGLRYWLIRGAAATSGWLGFVVQLAMGLIGHRPSNQEVNYGATPFVQFLAGPVHALDNLTHITIRALQSAYNAVAYAIRHANVLTAQEAQQRYLADHANRAHSDQVTANEAVARHYAVARVEGEASRWVANEAVTRHNAVVAAEYRATAQAVAVQHTAATWVAQEAVARHYAVEAAQLAAERTAAAYVDEEAVARHQAVQRAQETVEAEVVQPIQATWPILLAELAGATTAAGDGLPQLRALIDQVPHAAPATLPEAAAAPLDITRVLTRAMTDCTIPNCRNLSKYGRDLQGLGTLLGAAGLLAFLAYAVEDPAGAARNTEDTAVALIDSVIQTTESLLGVL